MQSLRDGQPTPPTRPALHPSVKCSSTPALVAAAEAAPLAARAAGALALGLRHAGSTSGRVNNSKRVGEGSERIGEITAH
mmetsp:Transcript_71487/g.214888  ORF Transcript_71487/g.214888 Transcript_71487/m.214888 type:complete len:80 (+) Transcript_71487:411-650(+)